MARYTIREFTEAVGLEKDRDGMIRSGIILKALCGMGVAKETGTKKHGSGRPAAVYEVSDPIVIPLGCKSGKAAQQAVVELAPKVEAASATQGFCYDDEEDD